MGTSNCVIPQSVFLYCSKLPKVAVTGSRYADQAFSGVMAESPFALNPDGSAQDPKAFQHGVRNDQSKLELLKDEPETLKVVLGDDVQALQELLRSTHQV